MAGESAAWASQAIANPAFAVLAQAHKAMASERVQSLQFTGSGSGALVGQSFEPSGAWPGLAFSGYAVLADYQHNALRQEWVGQRSEGIRAGVSSTQPSQRSVVFYRDTSAWNMIGPVPVATPWSWLERVHMLVATPHGALWAAQRSGATLALMGAGTAFKFVHDDMFAVTVQLNSRNQVQEIQTQLAHEVLGDVSVVTRFADYKLFNGVPFPGRIRQYWGGIQTLDIQVSQVQVNPSFVISIPGLVLGGEPRVLSEQLADGVWLLSGGPHSSVAIEMQDQVLLVDCPLSKARAQALFDAVQRLAPGKDIASVMVTHHHFDTVGGVRGAMDLGASVVVSQISRSVVERWVTAKRKDPSKPVGRKGSPPPFTSVAGKATFNDGKRAVEMHVLDGNLHAQGMLAAYLPKEKLLIQTDVYTPGPPFSQPIERPQEGAVLLVKNIARLKLDVERIVCLRGRVISIGELQRAAGMPG